MQNMKIMKYYNLGTDIRENIWNKSDEKRNFILLFFLQIFHTLPTKFW